MEGQFRITNQFYNKKLKNKTSDVFQKISQRINEQVRCFLSFYFLFSTINL